MPMAGESLTSAQRILWKRFDQHGDAAFMSQEELRDWARACRTLMELADAPPRRAPKASKLWRQRLAEAEELLADGGA